MALDPDVRAVLDRLAQAGGYELGTGTIEQDRAAALRMVDFQERRIELPRVEDLSIPTPAGPRAARGYWPSARGDLPILLFWHGGGWQMGGIETVDRPARALASRAGVIVLSASHRLAPEHPYPAAVEDGFAELQWVASNAQRLGGRPEEILVGGESSGGNVAAAVAIKARDDRGPAIAHQFLITPSLDADVSRPSVLAFGEGHLLTRAMMQLTRRRYYGPALARLAEAGELERLPALLAPLRAADLGGLPPATVVTCECDPLRDEGDAYAARLRSARVAVRHRTYEGLTHGSMNLAALVPAARRYAEDVAALLAQAAGTAGPRTEAPELVEHGGG
jgi:acetyl esterase